MKGRNEQPGHTYVSPSGDVFQRLMSGEGLVEGKAKANRESRGWHTSCLVSLSSLSLPVLVFHLTSYQITRLPEQESRTVQAEELELKIDCMRE